jgi:hypothetical protein
VPEAIYQRCFSLQSIFIPIMQLWIFGSLRATGPTVRQKTWTTILFTIWTPLNATLSEGHCGFLRYERNKPSNVLVFYCSETNFHKVSYLKQHMLDLIIPPGQKFEHGVIVLWSGFHRQTSSHQFAVLSPKFTFVSRVHFLSSCVTEISVFLLAVRNHSQILQHNLKSLG